MYDSNTDGYTTKLKAIYVVLIPVILQKYNTHPNGCCVELPKAAKEHTSDDNKWYTSATNLAKVASHPVSARITPIR